jgi:hypothetical protein
MATAADARANSVAQLQINLPAARDGRWQCDVRDEVARFDHGFAIGCAAG